MTLVENYSGRILWDISGPNFGPKVTRMIRADAFSWYSGQSSGQKFGPMSGRVCVPKIGPNSGRKRSARIVRVNFGPNSGRSIWP